MAIRGVRETIAQINQFGRDAKKQVNAEIEAVAFQIERDAKRLAPKNFGKLAQSISKQKVSPQLYRITVNEPYGAYMEFGTGAKVRVPDEFKAMADSFRNQRGGTFEDAIESIKIWCRSKGIPEEAAYPILAKILGAGIEPQPYLYPAFKAGEAALERNLKALLQRLNRRI